MYEEDITIDLDQFPDRMSTDEVAEALALTPTALNVSLSKKTIIIPFIKQGKRREFAKEHVRNYLENKYRLVSAQANRQLQKAS